MGPGHLPSHSPSFWNMFRFALATALATAEASTDDHPHLSQAWQANSVGDGQAGTVGLESYIYEDCDRKYTETCMRGHVFDYGASCTKYEVDAGIHSKYTGTYYVNCQGPTCCKGSGDECRPDPKQWDIGQSAKSEITYFGTNDIEDLDGAVAGADTWNEHFKIPIVGIDVNYTYYITQSGDDVISHRIDFSELSSAQTGQILYGQIVAKHADELDAFRDVFKAPDACLKPNTLTCNAAHTEEWDRKFFRGRLDAIANMPKAA